MLRITETVFNRLHKNRENCILQCRKHYARMKLSHWALHLMLCLKSECFHFAHCHQLSWCHFRACRRLFAWGLPGTFLVQQWEIPACSMLLSRRRVRSLTSRWPQHKKLPGMGGKGERWLMHLLGMYVYCSLGLWFYLRVDTAFKAVFQPKWKRFREVFVCPWCWAMASSLQGWVYLSCCAAVLPVCLRTSAPQLPPKDVQGRGELCVGLTSPSCISVWMLLHRRCMKDLTRQS